MGTTRLRSVIEHFDDALSMLRKEDPESRSEEETDPGTLEPEKTEDMAVTLSEAVGQIRRRMAVEVFGTELDRMPSRVLALESTETLAFTEELKPYMESYTRLTRTLYEDQSSPVCREDLEDASLLYVLAEMTGQSYDHALSLDSADVHLLMEETFAPVIQSQEKLDEFVHAVIPALARGAAAVGGMALRGAAKAGGALLRGAGTAVKATGKAAALQIGRGAAQVAARKATDPNYLRKVGGAVHTAARKTEAVDSDFVQKTRRLLHERRERKV